MTTNKTRLAPILCLFMSCGAGPSPLPTPEPAPQVDAGLPADCSAEPDLLAAAPACIRCSWTDTINGCPPSRCAQQPDGKLCCVQ
jgi:hypothetical protein